MFIGVDIGHTKVKAVAFDREWNVTAECGTAVGMEHPTENRHEIAIKQRWNIVLDCLSELQSQVKLQEINGIGLAGGGGGLYPLNADKQPFMNGIPLLDGRAKPILKQWKDKGTYQEISAITGIPIPPGAALLTLRWLKHNRPDQYDDIEHVLNLKDIVRYKLTGELALEISDATFSFTNHQTQQYDDQLLELAGIAEKRSALPELKPASYDIAGHTTKEVEQRTGVSKGTPVVAGAHDACANTLGAGGIEENIVTTVGGTSSLSTRVLDLPSVQLDRWCCENFLEPGTWMLEISTPTGTVSLDWFVDEFCQQEKNEANRSDRKVWDVIEEKIISIDTNVIFHPFLFGNPFSYLYQDNASGSFTGLRSGDGRIQMLRAVYEAIAFMHRWQIDLFDDAFSVNEVRFTGGAARSDFWAEVLADVLNKKVTVTTKDESGCFGAAMLAAIGVGEINSLEHTTSLINIKKEYYPGGTSYDRKYDMSRENTEHLKKVWDEHHALLK
jgi:L-xylulokinase